MHAGFHKTGTTTVQHTLRRNGKKLARHYRVLTRRQIPALCEAARAYSLAQDAGELALFTFEAAQLFETLDPGDIRPVLISAEDLAGHMPGRYGLTGYDAAPRLMSTLHEAAQTCRPETDMAIFLTTRASGPWLRSTYAQHVRAIRFTEDRDTYLARMADHDDLPAWVARIDAAVSCPVHSIALEQCAAEPFGPLSPLLDLLGAPPRLRARLTAVAPANPSFPDHILDQFLALNRSDLPQKDWADAKKQVMERWRARGGR